MQQNSSISEEAASASEELSSQAMELQGLMGRFNLSQFTATSQDSNTFIQPASDMEIPADMSAEKINNVRQMITLDDDNFGKY